MVEDIESLIEISNITRKNNIEINRIDSCLIDLWYKCSL